MWSSGKYLLGQVQADLWPAGAEVPPYGLLQDNPDQEDFKHLLLTSEKYCTIFSSTVYYHTLLGLYCNIVYSMIFHCTIMYCISLQYIVLYCDVLHWILLNYSAKYFLWVWPILLCGLFRKNRVGPVLVKMIIKRTKHFVLKQFYGSHCNFRVVYWNFSNQILIFVFVT